ncbi:hypothetical protein DEIGR_400061 [Deinococcus grandis]|uniref:Uncharacterized protein n=1 Tax=Deinococcus grandis TaxID=57498 RepID=A0A100HNE7_9DEIO|nr:DUF6527 family protein [Deinococcus grandis]GAQ23928.1 hypothetical protein DEIGR_400061 [Deinococcus grandis]
MTVRMTPGAPFLDGAAPGTIQADASWHHYVCPCGCAQVYSAAHAVAGGSVETGDLTLTPSLWHNGEGQCGWHGWLQNGEFRSV